MFHPFTSKYHNKKIIKQIKKFSLKILIFGYLKVYLIQ